MSKKTPKSTDGLMRYLRDNKGIDISGSSQKRKLMNMGYYHGYKGYRYINMPNNQVVYKTFDELLAVYNFDAQLKALFYPSVMLIETALKNYVLEILVSMTKSDSFSDIYNKLLDNHKMFSTRGKRFKKVEERKKAEEKFKRELKRRLELRNRIYKVHTNAYGNGNKIADHYLKKDMNLPIWATFELISLGEFGHFVSCLNMECRMNISEKLGIRKNDDTNAMLLQRIIYATKDLRNAIAHNDVVFDTRFRSGRIDKHVSNAIANACGIKQITFETITDYLILLIYQLKLIKVSKTEIKKMILEFEELVERLRTSIPIGIFAQIIHTDNNLKVQQLKSYVSSE